jgi:spore coat polysaccharide biosynthesis protein SpsF (cytidylyltransferase family)
MFRPIHVIAPGNLFWPNLGLTLDEHKDYIFLKKIIEFFCKIKKNNFSCNDVISLLKNNKKHWLKINRKVERKGDN